MLACFDKLFSRTPLSQKHLLCSMASNVTFMALRRRAPDKKDSTDVSTNQTEGNKNKKQNTHSSGKRNMLKLILPFLPSHNEFTTFLGQHSSNNHTGSCHNRNSLLCDLMKFWWWKYCAGVY